jgi:hypothetical protein
LGCPSKYNFAAGGLDLITVELAHPKRKKKATIDPIVLFIGSLLLACIHRSRGLQRTEVGLAFQRNHIWRPDVSSIDPGLIWIQWYRNFGIAF